jgi:MinD-like ATPase involved in chromosome partitioning or flagellar assembly
MAMMYDISLSALVDLIVNEWGVLALEENLFLRDAAGRLTFVVLASDRDGAVRDALSGKINTLLGGYADPSGISVATPEELFDPRLRAKDVGSFFPVTGERFQGQVRLVDRRVVGGDWLRAPGTQLAGIPRLFFVSLKGGVGRTTALCVLAAHLASNGQRVLALDLDLEAPGLGTMLLDIETLPKFGVLDYLVETNLNEVDELFIADMQGASKLTAGRGVVTVIPALGAESVAHPENVLSKIARAYLPSESAAHLGSFTLKIESLLDTITKTGDYDVVLVDARAGLHESTAAAAVALRGDTLLFGIDQPQTYAGYKALFSQLAVTLGSDWAARVHFVEARVGADGPSVDFLSNMTASMPQGKDAVAVHAIPLDQLRDRFDVDWDEQAGPDEPDVIEKDMDSTHIYESDGFRSFDPLKNPDRLDRGVYAAVFQNFLDKCDEILRAAESANEEGQNGDC